MRTSLKRASSLAAGAVIGFAIATAPAQAEFPDKPITLIYPWASGDPVETFLRTLGEGVAERLGQPVVINTVQGAGGKKAMTAGANAAPDGYTLTNNWVAPQIAGKLFDPDLPYDNSSYEPIAGIIAVPFTLTVADGHEANDLAEFTAWAKEKGSKLNYGVCAGQSVPRLVGEQFMRSAGLEFNSVPNNTGCMGDNITGLLNGSLDVVVSVVPATKIFEGQVKHLALISDEPHPLAPGLATVKEQGVEIGWGNAALGWGGLVAPANTPEDVLEILRSAIGDTVQSDEFREALGPLAPMINYVPASEFEQLWVDSVALLEPHVRAILESN